MGKLLIQGSICVIAIVGGVYLINRVGGKLMEKTADSLITSYNVKHGNIIELSKDQYKVEAQ